MPDEHECIRNVRKDPNAIFFWKTDIQVFCTYLIQTVRIPVRLKILENPICINVIIRWNLFITMSSEWSEKYPWDYIKRPNCHMKNGYISSDMFLCQNAFAVKEDQKDTLISVKLQYFCFWWRQGSGVTVIIMKNRRTEFEFRLSLLRSLHSNILKKIHGFISPLTLSIAR